MKTVSFCIPVYNEEKILISSLEKINSGLTKFFGEKGYEIIIIENGSTDKTKKILQKVKHKAVSVYYLKKKGLGLAYKLGIKQAKGKHIILGAIDLPFGFSDIKRAINLWDKYDIIYGSKALPDSVVYSSWERKLVSIVYRYLLRLFFRVSIKDTQGTVFLKKDSISKIISLCSADNAFFTAQIAIYGEKFNLKMQEIPIKFDINNLKIRSSRFNIFKEGQHMLTSMIKERLFPKK